MAQSPTQSEVQIEKALDRANHSALQPGFYEPLLLRPITLQIPL
jgi:hypothetical protein